MSMLLLNKKKSSRSKCTSTKDTRADLEVRSPGMCLKTLYMDVQMVNHKAKSFHSMERKELNKIKYNLTFQENLQK